MKDAATAPSLDMAATAPSPDACPPGAADHTGAGLHTLHVEYAVWSRSYRIIHTRPDGTRAVWRRGIETSAEALQRARVVAELTGYHVHAPTGRRS